MQPPTGNPTFYRGSDRILGGVCSGLAEGFHVEALWVRLAFVVLAFLQGIGVLLYVVLWILMPERAGYRPPGQNVFESMGSDMKRAWTDLRNQFGGVSTATSSTAAATATAPPSAPGEASAAGEPGATVATRTGASAGDRTTPSAGVVGRKVTGTTRSWLPRRTCKSTCWPR